MEQFKHLKGFVEYCIDDEDTAYIDFIQAYITGKKHGQKVLKSFLKTVKQEYKVSAVELIASDEFGTPLDKLVKFYSEFGFKVIQENSFGKMMRKEF